MMTLSLHGGHSAQVSLRRGLVRVLSAVAQAFESTLDVFAEAEDGSAAARARFPFAD